MAKEKIILPKVSEEIDTVIFVDWDVKVGDKVSEGDILATVETEKANIEIESDYDGEITALYVKQGDEIKLYSEIGEIEVD